MSRADLAEANYLKATARVSPGQKLMVPHEATALMAARTDRPVPATDSRSLGGRQSRAGSRLVELGPREGDLSGQERRHAERRSPASSARPSPPSRPGTTSRTHRFAPAIASRSTRLAPTSRLSALIKDRLPGGASRLALFLPQIFPVFSVIAGLRTGRRAPKLQSLFNVD